MGTFRAKLLPPKRTYWLGCVVASMEPMVSNISGKPYVKVRFANCPFIYTLGEYMGTRMGQAMHERGLCGDVLRVGDVVHLDVRWQMGPDRLYPRPEVDWGALLASRELEASLVDNGRVAHV